MKKYMVLCAGLSLAVTFTGCKSSESAYKKAYEKAQAQAALDGEDPFDAPVVVDTPTPVVTPVQTVPTTPVTTPTQPVVTQPVTTPQPSTQQRVTTVENVQVRQERVSVVSGTGLKNFSVVVGSFGVHANAEGLQQKLKAAGYDAQVVKNEDRNMYRVVASTFDTKEDAVVSRDQLRATYPDAWLLFNTK